ncbi:MAG: type II toxin-antitoxin system VapC family toxin [Desulfobacterales bacterium]
MKGTAVLADANVILDVFTNDPAWGDWSVSVLEEYSSFATLCINSIIYSEISIGFSRIEDLEAAIDKAGFHMLDFPREALFLAGKAFLACKKRKGAGNSPLPDFFIGAHAAVLNVALITRDGSRYRSYFPTLKLITP